jgi:Xaa-Pro aminopeptidase
VLRVPAGPAPRYAVQAAEPLRVPRREPAASVSFRLAVPADGPAFLVAPRLELRSVQASPAGGLGVEIVGWDETDDPYRLVADRLGRPESVGLADQMWATMVLRFRDALPGARQGVASAALRGLRIRKTRAEVAALREAGAAIDRVHSRVPEWLRPGRTEREVAADVAEAIVAEGHARADFVIVGSGAALDALFDDYGDHPPPNLHIDNVSAITISMRFSRAEPTVP